VLRKCIVRRFKIHTINEHVSTCFIYEMEMYTLFCLLPLLNPGKDLRNAKFGTASIRRILLMHLALCVCIHKHKIVYVIIDNIPLCGKFVDSNMGVSCKVHSKIIDYSTGVQKCFRIIQPHHKWYPGKGPE